MSAIRQTILEDASLMWLSVKHNVENISIRKYHVRARTVTAARPVNLMLLVKNWEASVPMYSLVVHLDTRRILTAVVVPRDVIVAFQSSK